MIASLLVHALDGPISPPIEDVAEGMRYAGRGLSTQSVIGPNRVTVGRWFNGTRHVPVETVTWISPGLVARWLGYLARLERWKNGELQRRWDLYRLDAQGRPLFFVALSAYPKQSLLDLTDESPADTQWLALDSARIMRRSGPIDGELQPIARWRARERAVIEAFEWWQNPAWAEWARPVRIAAGEAPLFELGDWYGAWYAVRGTQRSSTVQKIVLESYGKVRTADFSRIRR